VAKHKPNHRTSHRKTKGVDNTTGVIAASVGLAAMYYLAKKKETPEEEINATIEIINIAI
jgi:hypothetical protein